MNSTYNQKKTLAGQRCLQTCGKEGKVVLMENPLLSGSHESICHHLLWQDTLEEKWLWGRNEDDHYFNSWLVSLGRFWSIKVVRSREQWKYKCRAPEEISAEDKIANLWPLGENHSCVFWRHSLVRESRLIRINLRGCGEDNYPLNVAANNHNKRSITKSKKNEFKDGRSSQLYSVLLTHHKMESLEKLSPLNFFQDCN